MFEENFLQEHPGVAFKRLSEKAASMGIKPAQLAELNSAQRLRYKPRNKKVLKLAWMVPSVLVLLIAMSLAVQWPMSRHRLAEYFFDHILDEDMDKASCVLEIPDDLSDIWRPPVDCNLCKDVHKVDKVSGITPELFEAKYAYTGTPVVVTDGMKNWTAPEVFTFKFFKDIYGEDSPALASADGNCQFFPYKTNFHTLREVFEMSTDRAELKDGAEPWYIGWSNCDSNAANILRKHYTRPYFLPTVSESSKTDWIFMGSPGYGAHIHIDNVGNPSWQAQVTGTKEWTLEPVPECYHICPNQVKVTVYPGEIIVLDTNIWYHGTLITGKELSIVIGSEFD